MKLPNLPIIKPYPVIVPVQPKIVLQPFVVVQVVVVFGKGGFGIGGIDHVPEGVVVDFFDGVSMMIQSYFCVS